MDVGQRSSEQGGNRHAVSSCCRQTVPRPGTVQGEPSPRDKRERPSGASFELKALYRVKDLESLPRAARKPCKESRSAHKPRESVACES